MVLAIDGLCLKRILLHSNPEPSKDQRPALSPFRGASLRLFAPDGEWWARLGSDRGPVIRVDTSFLISPIFFLHAHAGT